MAGALQYLESQRNAQPDLAEWYSSLADLYQGKLWHQLTLKLEQFVALAVVQSKGSRETFQSRPSEDRTIPLSVVAKQTRLSIEDVEYLLMKSLSVHLIEGMIDQVEGTVHVSWVQPRVLGISQIKSLCSRLDTWAGKVHAALLSVEAEIPDLVAS